MIPAADPLFKVEHFRLIGSLNILSKLHTHNAQVTTNQITELAMFARKWLAPSKYHNMYVMENNAVQAALKQNRISLSTLSIR